ncbi:unnamed protein product [Lactuca saligna]|uniref:Uncharacterized protein n=1 Tax=Lactuca saligna TaxID=75948 RepID=A0AA35ZTL3_LACSI|nr:unnamed protein product [Lactuca saligna]
MNIPPHEIDASHLAGPIYVSSWGYRRDQSLMEPKVSMSFFENFAYPGTCSSAGQEIILWLDENEALHLENRSLRDEFKKISDLINLFVVLSRGVARNMQLFHDRHVELVEKVAELEKVMPNMGTTS